MVCLSVYLTMIAQRMIAVLSSPQNLCAHHKTIITHHSSLITHPASGYNIDDWPYSCTRLAIFGCERKVTYHLWDWRPNFPWYIIHRNEYFRMDLMETQWSTTLNGDFFWFHSSFEPKIDRPWCFQEGYNIKDYRCSWEGGIICCTALLLFLLVLSSGRYSNVKLTTGWLVLLPDTD